MTALSLLPTATGSKAAPKATVSLKGTNPLKGKAVVTIKKKF